MTDIVRDGLIETLDAENILSASASDYFALLKPRVMSLVVFTALVGMVIAPGTVNPVIAFTALVCIAAGAGAAGALNMWYDADIDRLMRRTASRPVPQGRISPSEALAFGLVLSFGSVAVLGILVNALAAALLAFTIFFYIVVYTMWLKRWTPQNIVIGGAAGALPPVVAWAAATGSLDWHAFVPFLIILLWTPPHSWALALFANHDYARAGVPMLPVVRGESVTKRHILAYSLIMVPAGMLPAFTGMATPAYGVVAAILGFLFLSLAWQLLRAPAGEGSLGPARRLFGFSLLYLFLLFAIMLAEHSFAASGLAG
jgi:protoheme IX farnesyltransferase